MHSNPVLLIVMIMSMLSDQFNFIINIHNYTHAFKSKLFCWERKKIVQLQLLCNSKRWLLPLPFWIIVDTASLMYVAHVAASVYSETYYTCTPGELWLVPMKKTPCLFVCFTAPVSSVGICIVNRADLYMCYCIPWLAASVISVNLLCIMYVTGHMTMQYNEQ